ncbi:dihydrolipoyl dehydrogenase family protein [Flagellimonas onchidii]|uniref:dihydrolipoyl dehydrogenase family protein n=1 Tax=Flagellimonas onchidii TaxID=2562684 RepID=UPI0010A5BD73|nr:FAD-dependent oxidoreductase [Allomuricauda onchidii]
MKKFDLIIVGGGRAINLAINAANRGKKVAVVEKSALGGTCPNRGCVPSKLLIGHANVIRTIEESDKHFISATIDKIDTRKIFDTNNKFISFIGNYIEDNVPKGVKIFKGEGKFASDKEILINEETITADKIVISTGSRPRRIIHKNAWSSDDIFPLRGDVPKSVTIVGAGFIGVELANFFDAIGVKTTLISISSEVLEREDFDIRTIFKQEFTKKVDVKFETKINEIDYNGEKFKLHLETSQNEKYIHETEVLIDATGRMPNTDALNLENTSIKVNAFGYIERNEFCETNAKGVYTVGDVSSKYTLQHAATYEVKYLEELFYGSQKKPFSFKYMAHSVFSDPEIASVGITEEEARAQNLEYVTSFTDWSYSAKAMSTRLDYPRTKFIVNPKTYEILGCHLIGPESSSIIHQVLSVMQIDNDIRHLSDMLYIHPALNEGIMIGAKEIIKNIKSS